MFKTFFDRKMIYECMLNWLSSLDDNSNRKGNKYVSVIVKCLLASDRDFYVATVYIFVWFWM